MMRWSRIVGSDGSYSSPLQSAAWARLAAQLPTPCPRADRREPACDACKRASMRSYHAWRARQAMVGRRVERVLVTGRAAKSAGDRCQTGQSGRSFWI